MQKTQIVIIGAGFAGLAAAREFLNHDQYAVTILEARDRIGGRAHTNFALGVPFDEGAFMIHGSDKNPMVELAQLSRAEFTPAPGLSSVAFPNGVATYSESLMREVDQQYNQLLKKAELYAQAQSQDISLAKAIQAVFDQTLLPSLTPELLAWRNLFQGLYCGADIEDVSAQHWDEDETPFTGVHLFMRSGYEPIIQYLAKNLNIQLNTQISKIHTQQHNVSIETNRGTVIADKVIITVPLSLLKKAAITFVPPLPAEKITAIDQLGMGLLEKIALKFPDVFWPAKRVLSCATEQYHGMGWFINYDYLYKQPILVGTVAGELARAYNQKDDKTLLQEVMRVLRHTFNQDLPQPIDFVRTHWESDPFSIGSYSYIPTGTRGLAYDVLAQPIANKLFFAGEATHRQYPGTTHGAYLSGLREAKRILFKT